MRTIPLHGTYGEGRFAVVDDDMFEFLNSFKWYSSAFGYAKFSFIAASGYKTVYMHHAVIGRIDGLVVDHINHNEADNRRENLRHVTHADNIRNPRPKNRGKSGFRGVSEHTQNPGRWRARIRIRDKSVVIGWFGSAEEASHAYEEYRRQNIHIIGSA